MTSVRYDVRDALRALLRSPGYTTAVILTLGLGIGLNTAIFTVVDAVLLKPLPYPEAGRLVRIAEWPHTGGNFTVAPAAYLAWRSQVRSFSHFEARVGAVLALQRGEAVEEVRALGVTPGYFDLLGIAVARGRTFTAADAVAGAPCTLVVTDRFLAARRGEAPEPGQLLRLGGRACEIAGVLPAGTVFDRAAVDVYLPLALGPDAASSQRRLLTVLGRLRPGVELASASAEMEALAAAFNATRGPAGRGWTTRVTPLRDVIIRADSRWLARMLFGAVAAVLAVACLNVAGLSLSRTLARRREIAIRAALGASRGRLFRSLLVESVLLACAGGAAGLLVGSWGLRAFVSLAPAGTLPPEAAASLDGRALLFTAAVSIATGVVFGLAPAVRATSAAPGDALARNRSAGPTRATAALHRGLLVLEVAFAIVLVVAATALTTSFVRLMRVDPGFAGEQVLTMRIALPAERYATGEEAARFFDAALDEVRRVPGVAQAAAVTSLPLGGWLFGTTFAIHGAPAQPERPPSAHIQHVSDGYPEALGLSLAAGRWFTRDDTSGSPRVAVVNETFVKRYLPDGVAIGRHLRLGITASTDSAALWDIVGVIRDVKTGSLADAALATPEIYVPHRQSPQPAMFFAVGVRQGDPARIVPALRAAIRGLDADLPIGELATMDERLGTSVQRERFRTTLIGSSAVLALLLACLGVYAIRSQAIEARIREMGVRLAIGASPRQLLSMVLTQGMSQVAIGIVAGLVLFVWVARFLEPWLFATEPTEPRVVAAATAVFATAALAASWMPARRAARVDPLVLLRNE